MTLRRYTAVALLAMIALSAPATAGAKTKVVFAGPPAAPPEGAPKGLELNDFYRKQVTVNVGDSVSWQFRGFHTVTFPGGGPTPPFVLPDPANPVTGQNDAAGNPFWFNGQPNFLISPQAASASGGGTFAGSGLRTSGLPLDDRPKPYKLKFTRAGTFRYLCLVHPGMAASVKVLPKGRSVPPAATDTRAARAEAAADVRLGARLDRVKPPKRVLAGHDRRGATLLKFYPQRKTVSPGSTVEFAMDSREEIHTVSFGPRAYRQQQARNFVAPRPGPAGQPPSLVLNPVVFFPSDPPPVLPPFTGANHGNGYLNSGVLDTDPSSPNPSTTRVTFATRGTFQYECLVHPGMSGTIRVQ